MIVVRVICAEMVKVVNGSSKGEFERKVQQPAI
jgi:hypothetical protein